MMRDKIFISYSHKDKKIFQELQTILKPLVSNNLIVVWDDLKIPVSSRWKEEIRAALDQTCLAILLVSPNFLASEFISTVELPSILKDYESNQLKVCWVLVEPCRYDLTGLADIQAAHDAQWPLSELSKPKRKNVLNHISQEIEALYKSAQSNRKQKTSHGSAPASNGLYMCFAREDERAAHRLQTDLQARQIPILNGQVDQISLETEQSIRRSAVVLALITKAANESAVYRNKILFALEEAKKVIIPVVLERGVAVMPELYGLKHFDLTIDGFNELTRTVQKLLQAGQVSAPKKKAVRNSAPATANPFLVGSSVPAEMFSGRQDALRMINEHVGNYYNLQSLSIVSNRRMGKTSLLRYVETKSKTVFNSGHKYVPVYIDAMDGATHSLSGFMRIIRQTLHEQHKLSTWKDKQDGEIAAFGDVVHRLAQGKKIRLVLLLDELEAIMAHQELDTLLYTLRSFGSRAEMGMITATAHELSRLEEDGKLTSRFSNIFSTYHMGNFSRAESDDLVMKAFARSRRQATDFETKLIFELAGGHPMLTQLAGSILWKAGPANKDRKALTREFSDAGRDLFSGILQRMPAPHLELTKRLLNIKTKGKIANSTYDEMVLRGILTEEREFFSSSFAQYARESLGSR